MCADVDPVTVIGRYGTCPGLRIGRAAAYEFQFDEEDPRARGRAIRDEFADRIQRVFVLLDEHIQLNQPIVSTSYWDDWWYVDLVEIEEHDDLITIRDQYVDLIVPPDVQPYRVVDLDELGDALQSGRLSVDNAVQALRNLQSFIDAHLHLRTAEMTAWRDFPPAAIREPLTLPRWVEPQ
jgi:hypothetical protein